MIKQEQVKINDEHVAHSFYDDNLPTALRAAEASALETGSSVQSMPEILVLRRKAPFSNPIWSTWYTCKSEEDVGTTAQENKVVIAAHGGGILTPERMETAYERGLTKQHAAPLAESEIRTLLAGKLADGTEIPVYLFSDFKVGIKDLPQRYAVVMDFAEAQKAASGYLPVESLRENPLVIVRAGGVAQANAFVDKVAQRYTQYGNWHRFNEINPAEAQGRVLFVGSGGNGGLSGDNYLDDDGRFLVGVAPEARVGAKRRAPLEDMVSVKLPRNVIDAMRSGNEFTYDGRTYCIKQKE